MRNISFLVLLMSLLASPALAQTPVPANSAVTIEWDHDGVSTDGYKLVIDAVATDLGSVTANPSGVYQTNYAGFAIGNHVVEVVAYSVFGETTSSPLSVVAGIAPAPPTGVRVAIPTT